MLNKEPSSPKPAKKAAAVFKPRPQLARKSYQRFSKTRKDLMRASSRVRMQSRAVEFRRIWWDKSTKGATRLGMSVWRPSPPSGYTSLGLHSDRLCAHPFWNAEACCSPLTISCACFSVLLCNLRQVTNRLFWDKSFLHEDLAGLNSGTLGPKIL